MIGPMACNGLSRINVPKVQTSPKYINVKYPVEVQVRNKEGLVGTAILQYLPQRGVFVNAK